MSEEPTHPNLIELTRRLFSFVNERDYDGMMSFFGPYSLWDVTPWGLGAHSGRDTGVSSELDRQL
jgi:hypothetical protein